MFEIPFTQYLLPDGRTKTVHWVCKSEDQERKAKLRVKARAIFECEMLGTGDVSLTCEREDHEGQPQTLAHEICSNDKSVVDAVEKLINIAFDRI